MKKYASQIMIAIIVCLLGGIWMGNHWLKQQMDDVESEYQETQSMNQKMEVQASKRMRVETEVAMEEQGAGRQENVAVEEELKDQTKESPQEEKIIYELPLDDAILLQ